MSKIIGISSVTIIEHNDSIGENAYTVSLSNENHTIACNSDGMPQQGELEKAYSQVVVYCGSKKLTAVSSTPKETQFKITIKDSQGCQGTLTELDTVTINNIINSSLLVVDSDNIANVMVNNDTALIDAHIRESGYLELEINCENKIKLLKKMTFTKAKSGANGNDADNLYIININGPQFITYDSFGYSSPKSLKFTAQTINFNDYDNIQWCVINNDGTIANIGTGINSEEIDAKSSYWNNDQIKLKAYHKEYEYVYDEQTIHRIHDGSKDNYDGSFVHSLKKWSLTKNGDDIDSSDVNIKTSTDSIYSGNVLEVRLPKTFYSKHYQAFIKNKIFKAKFRIRQTVNSTNPTDPNTMKANFGLTLYNNDFVEIGYSSLCNDFIVTNKWIEKETLYSTVKLDNILAINNSTCYIKPTFAVNQIGDGVVEVDGLLIEDATNSFELNELIKKVDSSVKDLGDYVNDAFHDGIITEVEAKGIEKYIIILNNDKATVVSRVTGIRENKYLTSKTRTKLDNALTDYNNKHSNQINLIKTAISDGKTTGQELFEVNQGFIKYSESYALLIAVLEEAIKEIIENNANDAVESQTPEDVFNKLTDNGKKQGIIMDENGDLYINGTYIRAKGLKVSNNNITTFEVSSDNNIVLRPKTFELLSGATTNVPTKTEMTTNINNVKTYIDGAFHDGVITEVEASGIQKHLNVLAQDKLVIGVKVDTISNDIRLEATFKNTLLSLSTLFNTASDNLKKIITDAIADKKATPQEITNVNTAFNTYNESLKDLEVAIKNCEDNITKNVSQDVVNNQTPESVFNKLTDNGKKKGIIMDSNGDLYVNGTYIQAGTVTAEKMKMYNLSVVRRRKKPDNTWEELDSTFTVSDDGRIKASGTFSSFNFKNDNNNIGLSEGWMIDENGDSVFNNTIVRGRVELPSAGVTDYGGPNGGDNLLAHSYDFKANWNNASGIESGINESKAVVNKRTNWVTGGSRQQITHTLLGTFVKNEDITISGYYYVDSSVTLPSSTSNDFIVRVYDGASGSTKFTDVCKVPIESSKTNQWIKFSATAKIPNFTSVKKADFVFSITQNGYVKLSQPKVEKSTSASKWSPATSDGLNFVRFWAGSPYDKRDIAPFKVMDDGSVHATKGNFGGTFTGKIQIGNITIEDKVGTTSSPSKGLMQFKTDDNKDTIIQLGEDHSYFKSNVYFGANRDSSKIAFKKNNLEISSGGKIELSETISGVNKTTRITGGQIRMNDSTYMTSTSDSQICLGTKQMKGKVTLLTDEPTGAMDLEVIGSIAVRDSIMIGRATITKTDTGASINVD